MENFYQGALDVFLVGVRADFDSVENQAKKSVTSLKENGLLRTDKDTSGIFTEVSNMETQGNRTVFRHTGTTGNSSTGARIAGGVYPAASFLRLWETVVLDPNLQDANQITVPEERLNAESAEYKDALDRAEKLNLDLRRKNIGDPFDIFNLAFVAPSSYPSVKFVGKGNNGLDGNNTALGEALITYQHKIAFGNATQATSATATNGCSNGVGSSSNYAALSPTSYNSALEQGATFVDDVNKPMAMFGGAVDIIVPRANGLVATAKQLNESDWQIGTANNEVNVFKSTMGKIISSPFLTNSINYTTANSQNKKWYLIDNAFTDPKVGTGLVQVCFVPTQSFVFRSPEMNSLVYQAKQSYSYTWLDWRNVLASLGDGSAQS
jgi:hypothetical protein